MRNSALVGNSTAERPVTSQKARTGRNFEALAGVEAGGKNGDVYVILVVG